MAQRLPQIERLLPIAGKDWNEQILGTQQAVPYRLEFSALWQWYRAAFTLGRSEKYTSRIREVAVAFIKGESLLSKAKAAMRQDLSKISPTLSVGCEV